MDKNEQHQDDMAFESDEDNAKITDTPTEIDQELMNQQRRKSRPMVVIQEFVPDEEQEQSPLYTGPGTGTHKEVTHVEVSGEDVSA